MDHDTVAGIQAIGSLLAVGVAFVAVVLTAISKRFDARRAYVEFVLKQRLDVAGELIGSFAVQFQKIAEAASARIALRSSTLGPDARTLAEKQRDQALITSFSSMERLNRAAALATTLYGPELQAHVGELFAMVQRANESGGIDFNFQQSNSAISALARYFWQELNVEHAIKYQKAIFQPDWTRWLYSEEIQTI